MPRGSGVDRLEHARRVVSQIIGAVATNEVVYINVADNATENRVLRYLGTSHANIRFCRIKTSSVWCRDYSPTFVRRRDPAWRTPPLVAVDWGYEGLAGPLASQNARSGDDGILPMIAARTLRVPCVAGGMVLHGRDFETNGHGVLLVDRDRVLRRNPTLSVTSMCRRLEAMLGASEVVCLDSLPCSDGQVERMARFVDRSTVIVPSVAPAQATNRPPTQSPDRRRGDTLLRNRRLLEAIRVEGQSLKVLSMPAVELRPIDEVDCASYTDFYIANDSVLLPQFQTESDGVARDILAKTLENRTVFPVSSEIRFGGGWIHGLVSQVPQLYLS